MQEAKKSAIGLHLLHLSNINSQFNNIRYVVLEGLQNVIIPEIAYNEEMNYEDNLAGEIQKLEFALDEITMTDETLLFKKQLKETTTNVLLSRPEKKAKSRSMFFTQDDSKGTSNMFEDEA